MPEGFAHNVQSLRVVDRLEKDGEGLNLTWESPRRYWATSCPMAAAEIPAAAAALLQNSSRSMGLVIAAADSTAARR